MKEEAREVEVVAEEVVVEEKITIETETVEGTIVEKVVVEETILEEVIVEEHAKHGGHKPKARRYIVRIDSRRTPSITPSSPAGNCSVWRQDARNAQDLPTRTAPPGDAGRTGSAG